ncbi:MAG TPA: hypothetical protein EYM55_03650, partial [Candidatus Marinimicrobia bacterium]|nr:hypothetical protein [Candidatus Neomarinimicrobiota bacterium]
NGGGFLGWVTDDSFSNIARGNQPDSLAHDRVVTADQIGEGFAVYLGINIFGSEAGEESIQLFSNALQYVTGNTIIDWLSVDPEIGTVPVGSSQIIEVTFDASEVEEGDYTADILINSNDPDEPEVNIPVTLVVTALPVYNGPVWHVSNDGSDSNGNGSGIYPFATIQHGIDVSSDDDTVLVQPGTYVENINYYGKNIVVRGEDRETTIIDGNQNGSVVTFESGEDSTAVLSGFTITNGFEEFGGGIRINFSSPKLENAIVSSNTADVGGGGIYCSYSDPIIEEVTIEGNYSQSGSSGGGGIYLEDSNPVLTDVTIANNNSSNLGGGLACWVNSSPSLTNVTFTGNSATYGGGIFCTGNSHPIFENVEITGNSAITYGGGIYTTNGSNPMLINATIAHNFMTADHGTGGGIHCENGSNPILVNSILWNNSPQEVYFFESGDSNTITISYSDVAGGQDSIITNDNGTVIWGDGNIDTDPLFIDPENSDYHLTENSPCIDAGAPFSDYFNEPDYNGRRINLGVYGGTWMATPSNPEIEAPEEMAVYGTELETSDTLQISILNTGTSYLNVDSLVMEPHPAFSWESENSDFRIEPEGEIFVGIVFTPQDTNEVNTVILIHSNDEDEGEVTMALTGQGYHEVPVAPTGLVAEPWDSEVTLFWDQYEDTTIAKYNIWRGLSDSTISILDEIAPEATSYTDTTVTNGETYIYVLTAEDSLGYESGYSNWISVTPLGPALAVAPDSLFYDVDVDTLQLEIVNEGYGDLLWSVTDAPEWVTVVSDSAGQTVGQTVSLSKSFSKGAVPPVRQTFSLSNKNPTSKSDIIRDLISTNSRVSGSDTILVIVDRSGLDYGMYYGDIHIASNGGDRTVAVEMEVPEIPTAPTGLVAEPWDSEVTLLWDHYEDTTIAEFNIWRGPNDSTFDFLDMAESEATSYTDSSVTNGETYFYVLTVVNLLGYESGYSNWISTTPLGPALAVAPDSLLFHVDVDTLQLEIVNEGYGDLTWDIGGLPSWLDIQTEGGLRIPSGRRNGNTPERREMVAMESHKGREVSASVAPLHKTITSLPGVDTLLAIVDRYGLNYGIYDTTVDITSNGGDFSLYVWIEVPNYAPYIAVTSFEAEQRDTVEIEFSLDDAEGDSVLLNVLYSFDESMTETFSAFIEEELVPLGPDDYEGTLHWLTAEDLPEQEVDIFLLVEASDSFNVNSFVLPVHVDNYTGNILLEPLTGEVEGDAEISYTIEDPWGDTFSIVPQFLNPLTGEWTAATVSGQMEEIGPEDYSGTLTWHTAEDFPSYEEPVSFRILPHDGLGYGSSDEITVDVDNLGPPQVITYSPAEDSLAIWISPELEVTFSRDIDPATVEGAISISGEITDDHSFTHTYDDASRVLTLTVDGVFSSLETVTFFITPDLTDLDGIPFDGNGNGDVDDPADDIFTGTFTTTILGDYT